MTPHSTDRAHSISPLDLFGAISHAPASGAEPAHGFEAMLNKVTSAKTAGNRHTQPQSSTDQPVQGTDRRGDSSLKKTNTSGGKRTSAKASHASGPQRKEDDQDSDDPSAQNQAGSTSSTDSSQASAQADDSQDDQDAAADQKADTKDAESDQDAGYNTAEALAAIAEQRSAGSPDPNLKPSESESESNTAPVVGSESPLGANKNPSGQSGPDVSGDAAVSSTNSTDTIPGTDVPPSAELDQNSTSTADPIAAIDGQTAAATAEVQPVDSASSSGETKNSSEKDGDAQTAADPFLPPDPSVGVLPGQDAQNQSAAVPPPTVSNAPPVAKDTPQPQPGNAQQTAAVPPATSRLPQHVLTRTEVHRGHNPAPVPVDSARFISRVAKAFISAQQREGNGIRLRLSPPELGSLKLQVSVQDGVMVARMETETEAARSSLVNNLPTLRDRLAEQGIRVERFDIDLMQRPSTGTPDRPSDPQQQHEPEQPRLLRTPSASQAAPAILAPSGNWNGNGRLNVII